MRNSLCVFGKPDSREMTPPKFPDDDVSSIWKLVPYVYGVITAFHIVLPVLLVFSHDGMRVRRVVWSVWHICGFALVNNRTFSSACYPINDCQDVVSIQHRVYELPSGNSHDKCYSSHLHSTTLVYQVPYKAVLLVDYDLSGRNDARTAFSEDLPHRFGTAYETFLMMI